MEKTEIIQWVEAAAVRAVKTAAQAAVGVIGATTYMGGVDWALVASTAALSAILSLLTSVAGIPEVGGGASVAKLAKHAKAE
ncbi:MAG: hypothetical protein IJO87_10520 [Eggerthellaceae bacterium]|nr:hypothetical protein [Eggerthellaceae bacterium]